MKQIFTLALGILCLSLSVSPLFAQCPAGGETFTGLPPGNNADFNGNAETGTGTVSFFGVYPSPTDATNYQLQLGTNTNGPTTYKFTSPTYNLPSSVSTVYVRFTYGANGSASFSNVTVGVRYIANNYYGQPTLYETPAVAYTSGQCLAVNLPTGHLTNGYQILIYFNDVKGNGNNNPNVFIDNFATTGTLALAPLPVHFSSLTVQRTPAGALLTWKVEAEENVSVYEVETSNDGRSFTKLSTVEAQNLRSYTAMDNRPAAGPAFYRIKSVDIDGRFLYSTVVVLAGDKASVQIKAFMSDKNTLTVQHDAAEAGSRILVTSMDGRVVKSVIASAGAQQTRIDLSAAQTGLYIVRYDNGAGDTQSIKFVKQ